MAFSGTDTAHIFALVWFLTVVELISEKHFRAATIKKAHPALGKNKAPLSPLSWYNKTYNEADCIKTYILACVGSHCESKIIYSNCLSSYPSMPLDLLPCNLPVPLNLPCISTVPLHLPSGFHLKCAYYSMVFIVLVYNSGSQNILLNDWYACLHVLSKQLAVWNAQFVCWVITKLLPR